MKKLLFIFVLWAFSGQIWAQGTSSEDALLQYSNIFKQEKNGRWGMTGLKGANEETLIPFEYEYLSPWFYDWMIAKKNGKYGMINRKNQVVVPFQYDDMVDNVHQGYAVFKKGKKWGIINRKGAVSVPFEYDKIEKPALFEESPGNGAYTADWLETGSFAKNNFIAQKSGLYGIINGDGTVVLPLEYQEIRPTSGDCNMILKKNNKYAIYICYSPGKCQFKYDSITLTKSNLFIVSNNGKMGLAGHEDQAVLPLEYEDIRYLERNFYAFKKAGKYGISAIGNYDAKITTVLPLEYDAIAPFSVRYAQINRNGKLGLFEYSVSKLALRPVFESITVTKSGQLIVKNSGLYGVHNAAGKEVVLPVYDALAAIPTLPSTIDKVYLVKREQKTGLIDSTGAVIIPLNFDSIVYLQHSIDQRKQLAGCKESTCLTAIYKAFLNKQIYLFNSDGKPFNTTGVDKITVENNCIRTELNKKQGLITTTGLIIAQPEYEVLKIGDAAAIDTKKWRLAGKITADIHPFMIGWKKKDGPAELLDDTGRLILTL